MAAEQALGEEGTLLLEQRFAVVPEWVIDAQISDCAFRLYAVLLRYGNTSGQRMPGRALLAKRLHKASKDTVDRALKELVAIGAVTIEHRRAGRQNLTNRYHVRITAPGSAAPAHPAAAAAAPTGRNPAATPAGRRDAATPPGRSPAATPGRTDQATVAAPARPDPEVLTEEQPPPAPPARTAAGDGDPTLALADRAGGPALSPADRVLLARCGIPDLDVLAARCQDLRRRLGQPAALWAAARLIPVLREAVDAKGWPAPAAAAALLAVAGDPATRSPTRLSCPGPWWDRAADTRPSVLTREEVAELDRLEVRLREADGRRVWLQQRARADLTDRGQPLTRLGVARRACQLLDEVEMTAC